MRHYQEISRGRGMVTVELAIGILTALVLAAGLIFSIQLAVLQARCHDTAVAVARQLGRQDNNAAQAALAAGPANAKLATETNGSYICATVTASASFTHLAPISVHGKACAYREES